MGGCLKLWEPAESPLCGIRQVAGNLADARWVPELAQGLGLNLADSLARHIELAPHFLQGAGVTVTQPEALLNHGTFSGIERIEHIPDLVAQGVVGGSETRPRVCETEAEVTALGGRLQWEDGESANFEPVLQITALIRCPEGVDGPFPYTYEGADYAVCRWYLRGTGFKAAGRTILTHAAQLAKTQRPLHEARFELTTKREKLWNGNAVSVPQLRMAGKHDEGFCSFAESLIG